MSGISFAQISAAEQSGHFGAAEIAMAREHAYIVGPRYYQGLMMALDEATEAQRAALRIADPSAFEAWEAMRSGDLVERIKRESMK